MKRSILRYAFVSDDPADFPASRRWGEQLETWSSRGTPFPFFSLPSWREIGDGEVGSMTGRVFFFFSLSSPLQAGRGLRVRLLETWPLDLGSRRCRLGVFPFSDEVCNEEEMKELWALSLFLYSLFFSRFVKTQWFRNAGIAFRGRACSTLFVILLWVRRRKRVIGPPPLFFSPTLSNKISLVETARRVDGGTATVSPPLRYKLGRGFCLLVSHVLSERATNAEAGMRAQKRPWVRFPSSYREG